MYLSFYLLYQGQKQGSVLGLFLCYLFVFEILPSCVAISPTPMSTQRQTNGPPTLLTLATQTSLMGRWNEKGFSALLSSS